MNEVMDADQLCSFAGWSADEAAMRSCTVGGTECTVVSLPEADKLNVFRSITQTTVQELDITALNRK